MASTYNRVGRPAVVAVRDGTSRRWLRREEPEDLDRLEVDEPATPSRAAARSGALEGLESAAGVLIRAARPADAHSFVAAFRSVAAERRYIRTETVGRSTGHYRRRFRRSWDEHGAHVLALEGARVVGSVSIHRDEHPTTRHVATLGMFVTADHRGRGIGTALMDAAMRWAWAFGIERLELSVYPDNAAARALYRRFGFVEEGRLVRRSKKSYGYEDEILMAVRLDDRGAT
jgi:RimJ/RimL family protein N-acetyltransferase